MVRVVGQWRQTLDVGDTWIVTHVGHHELVDDGAGCEDTSVLQRDVFAERAAVQASLKVVTSVGLIGLHVFDDHHWRLCAISEWIVVVDDDLLGNVDQTTG